jgi:hypothetical protein
MELMKVEHSEEEILEKDFVPVFMFFFPGKENELTKLIYSKEPRKKAHIEIDPAGKVLFDGKEISSSN